MKKTSIKLMLIAIVLITACKAKKSEGTSTTDKTEVEMVNNTYNLYVASKQVDCQGVAPQKCLLVRKDGETEWTNFYDIIEGFEYESGYEYQLNVKRITLDNPPADASAYRYVLVDTIKKEKKTSNIEEGNNENAYNLYVASKQVDCQGVAPQKCLLVRKDGETEWTNFYDVIEGFEYESGYEYKLNVKHITLENPPADAPAFRYVLLNVLNKEKKDSDLRAEDEKSTFEGTWNLKVLNGKEVSDYKAKIVFTNNAISAYSGCNTAKGLSFSEGENSTLTVKKNPVMASTLIGCPDGHIEDAYFKAILEIAKYEATSHTLTCFDKDNKTILVFER